jgi:penicillin amidase
VADFFNEGRYESSFGASYRQVVEMIPGEVRGWWVLPPGNHGSSLSPFYRDQVQMWLKGEYAPMWFYDGEIEANCALAAIIIGKGVF